MNIFSIVSKAILLLTTVVALVFSQSVLSFNNNRLSPLGINTNEVMDMDSSVPFVDLFKQSMPFEEARPWLTKGKIDYDEYGWPKNLNGGQAGTRFVNNFPAKSIPNTVYIVTYKGKGKIRYGGNADLIRRMGGRDYVRIRAGKTKRITATLIIMESDPNNYIRDIKIVLPGGICENNPYRRVRSAKHCTGQKYLGFLTHSEQIIFNPDYLNFMKDFRVIRFMNMSGITRNEMSRWDQRPKLTDSTWGGKEGKRGLPLEVMIQLANALDVDPWFNLPHRADDEFIKNYAEMVKQRLEPELKAYVEYSNEAWNGIFTQTHYMMDMGQRLALDANRTYAGFKYYSRRSVDIFKAFETAFGNTQRLVRVMGGMATNIPLTHMVLGYEDAFKHTDALAIAPYFHAPQKLQKQVKSVDAVFDLLKSPRNPNSIPRTLNMVRQQSKMATRYGIDLIAYEGGQHLVSYKTHSVDEGANPYLIKANKDDRMAKLYYEFLKGWKKSGGKLFVAFSAPRDYNWIGSWGIKEYITQNPNVAPKYRGLMYFQKNERCWWYGCTGTRIGRHSKPAYNPAAGVMARRFKKAEKPIYRDTLAIIAKKKQERLKKSRKEPVVERKSIKAKASKKPDLFISDELVDFILGDSDY
ncbi:MAG: hypothetical protein KAH22_08160 [Thiotrichaceae bacterium]|nr:hypothetical protein [Thiotrichaceae bacterium]